MKQAALILALVLAIYGCTAGSDSAQTPAAAKGPAPDFDLENIAGGKLNSADLKGKILVVDFWATWCEPCIVEIPKFNKLSDEYKGKPVEIVGITIESPYDDIKPKVDETGIKYTVVVGNDKVVEGFGGIYGFPTTFVVNKDFQIYRKYIGALADKDARIKKDIEKLLASDSAD